MTFEVLFECSSFFSGAKCNGRFNAPRTVFGCVRVISLIVRLQAGFQIIRQTSVSASCVFIIQKDINISEALHFSLLAWVVAFGFALTCAKA